MDTKLQDAFLADAQRSPQWHSLSDGARLVATHYIRNMGRSGEVFASSVRRATMVPALTTGRPSQSGHMSRPTLQKYERELEASGLFTSWWTNGKRLANGLRTAPIKIMRLSRTVWGRAWARFKYAFRRTFLHSDYRSHAKRKVASSRSRYRSSSFIPGWADNCAFASGVNRLRRQKDHERERNRRWHDALETGDFGAFDEWLFTGARP
jgi:hypothetical protein